MNRCNSAAVLLLALVPRLASRVTVAVTAGVRADARDVISTYIAKIWLLAPPSPSLPFYLLHGSGSRPTRSTQGLPDRALPTASARPPQNGGA